MNYDPNRETAGRGCGCVLFLIIAAFIWIFITIGIYHDEIRSKEINDKQASMISDFGPGKIVQIYTTRSGTKYVHYPVRVVIENHMGERLVIDSNGTPVVEGDVWTLKLVKKPGSLADEIVLNERIKNE